MPYKIRAILIGDGIQSTKRKQEVLAFMTPFDRGRHSRGVEHRSPRAKHPRTNGQVERMNRTIKEATVGRYHCESRDELEKHLHAFLMAYNPASRLKTLKEKSPTANKTVVIFRSFPTATY